MRLRAGSVPPTLRLALCLAVSLQVPPTGTPTAVASSPTKRPATFWPRSSSSSSPPSVPFVPQEQNAGRPIAEPPEQGGSGFYSWRALSGGEARALWEELPAERPGVRAHPLLSQATRRADRFRLSFPFPYFGHDLTDIGIATGGFLSTIEGTGHVDLTSAQFIAPLMADFAPGLDPRSSINHFDNGSVMVVEWRNVRLQNDSRGASFTFQVSLHRSGTIVFAYREVPVPIASLATARHPVRVGLSDAFTVTPPDAARPARALSRLAPDRDPTGTRGGAGGWSRRVLYEYERLMLDVSLVRSGAAIQFLPLPMCQQLRSCAECISARIGFHCFWCHGVGRCSHGMLDRYRQEWVHAGCPEKTHGDICGEDPERNLTSTAPGTRGGATTAPSGVSLGEERRRNLEEATPSAGPPQGGPRAGGLVTLLGTLAVLLLLLVVAAARWARRPPGGDERLTGCLGRLRPTPRQPPYEEVCEMQ
ncbi:unnamed protein product [Lampetra planeri]